MANVILQSFRNLPSSYQLIKGKCLHTGFFINNTFCATTANSTSNHIRHSSFRSSYPVGNIEDHPEVEIVENPPEYSFVEHILPKSFIPEPKVKSGYPSGWKPPNIDRSLPYYVQRTKNHMCPVYLERTYRGARQITKLRKIQGDIWSLEVYLKSVIEARIGKKIATRINEMNGQIMFKGDYVNLINDCLARKGF